MKNVKGASIVCGLCAMVLSGCGAAPEAGSDEPIGAREDAWSVGNWSVYSGALAAGAFTTGNYSLNLPVCRADYDGGQQPGKFWQGQCLFEWGGQKHTATTFQTLVNNGRMSWYRMTAQYCDPNYGCLNQRLPTPQNAIDGGRPGNQATNQNPLGVCKANKGGEWHPGKFYAGKCNIEWNGTGFALDSIGYDVYVAISN